MTYIDQLASEIEHALPLDQRPAARAQELYRLYALLVLTRGDDVTLEDVHNAWSTWMTAQEPTHPALKPFAELSLHAQREDEPYAAAIQKVSRDRRSGARVA